MKRDADVPRRRKPCCRVAAHMGCDFLDAARSDTLWAKAKTSVIKPSASWTFDLLKEWLKAEISSGLPTLRGLTS